MASINIIKLRFQIAELLDHFSEPEQFCKTFYEIMDFYSQRSLRPGNDTIIKTFLPTFNCPDQVIKHIILTIRTSINHEPQEALNIADELWKDPHLESRELAAKILGRLPVNYADQIMNRITLWATPNLDKGALELLFSEATQGFALEFPDLITEANRKWLENKEMEYQIIGLQGLIIQARKGDYDRLPSLFKLITPFMLETEDELIQLKTIEFLTVLSKRTPIETAYYLKQSLAFSNKNLIIGIIRRLLSNFPIDLSIMLQEAIKLHQS